jgi:alkanesulfonate monooxygenase SsuD/methylene tetrahydromethanopterin reductase-like flavin-dependent oxidoreductase (luciferase family)
MEETMKNLGVGVPRRPARRASCWGTSIIPTFPRHPLALVQGAQVVDALAPGRLRLGVGPSHKPSIEGTWGIPFARPQEHLPEYLTILRAALNGGKVDFDGRRLRAHAQLPGPTRVTVMASALRPRGVRTCGELADGAISWVCPLPYLRGVTGCSRATAPGCSQPKGKCLTPGGGIEASQMPRIADGGLPHERYR